MADNYNEILYFEYFLFRVSEKLSALIRYNQAFTNFVYPSGGSRPFTYLYLHEMDEI